MKLIKIRKNVIENEKLKYPVEIRNEENINKKFNFYQKIQKKSLIPFNSEGGTSGFKLNLYI